MPDTARPLSLVCSVDWLRTPGLGVRLPPELTKHYKVTAATHLVWRDCDAGAVAGLALRISSLPRRLGFVALPGSIDIRTTVADHEIAHLTHCRAIKFSEAAAGNCRQD